MASTSLRTKYTHHDQSDDLSNTPFVYDYAQRKSIKNKQYSYCIVNKLFEWRRAILWLTLLSIIVIFIIDYWNTLYRIPYNPLTFTLDYKSLSEINALKLIINEGKDYIHHGNKLCLMEQYINDLNNNSKATFLSLISDSHNLNYLRCLLVWIYQIHKLHSDPAIPITVAIDQRSLDDFGGDRIKEWFTILGATDVIIVSNVLHNDNDNVMNQQWQNIYSKIELFNPKLYERYGFKQIAYFDADNFPLQSMYELFHIPCSYLLGAANGICDSDCLDAAFLVIRPDKVVYDTLMTQYDLEIKHRHSQYTEQQMLRDLFDGKNERYNRYWYTFPYEYNTPLWDFHWNDAFGGVEAQKNIHHRQWKHGDRYSKNIRKERQMWTNVWNEVWEILPKHDRISLGLCNEPELRNDKDICTKEMINKYQKSKSDMLKDF